MTITNGPSFVVECDTCFREHEYSLWDIAAGEAYCKPAEVLAQKGWRVSDEVDVCPECARPKKKTGNKKPAQQKAATKKAAKKKPAKKRK